MAVPWDMDGNGVADFVFQNNGRVLETLPQTGAQILALPATPPDLGAYVLPLAAPSELGSFDYSPARWVSSELVQGFPSRAFFISCSTAGCSGPFAGLKAFFGFSVEIGGAIHYGWATLNAENTGAGGILEDYAYNLTPGAPIFVGQVPEPGTTALPVAGGGFFWWWFSRMRRPD